MQRQHLKTTGTETDDYEVAPLLVLNTSVMSSNTFPHGSSQNEDNLSVEDNYDKHSGSLVDKLISDLVGCYICCQIARIG